MEDKTIESHPRFRFTSTHERKVYTDYGKKNIKFTLDEKRLYNKYTHETLPFGFEAEGCYPLN